MKAIRLPTTAEHQANRIHIARILRSEAILDCIKVNIDGRLRTHSISWNEYWSTFHLQMPPAVNWHLHALRAARRDYIFSGFSLPLARSYCHAYFSLLQLVLLELKNLPEGKRLLHAILGFECTAVRWPDQFSASAAITSNVRNPVYLLSKLREPRAYDDPKFLPLITVWNSSPYLDGKASLYFHYRQIKIAKEEGICLLAYPSVEISSRPDSFACIQNMISGLTHKKDPRCRRRSKLISNGSIGPFFSGQTASEEFRRTNEIKIADLGAGGGGVLREICERLLEDHPHLTAGKKFSWTAVDVKFRNPKRHARNRRFRQHLSSLRWEQADYLSWIDRQPVSGNEKPFHVILLCRLLNNLSDFSIGWIDDWPQVQKLALRKLTYHEWQQDRYRPHVCLRQERFVSECLIASNARVQLLRGSSFCQASLTDYYRALYRVEHDSFPEDANPEAIFFPIRRFKDSSLLLPSGDSAVKKLASLGRLLVIEDIDCRASELRRHLESHNLYHLAASDSTDRRRMRSSRLLCVCSKEDGSRLPGKRIW